MRSQKHYGRPVFEFSLGTTMTSNQLQQRYTLQTQPEAYETSELKVWPIHQISDLLSPSNTSVPINPSCHAALAAYVSLFC